MATTTTLKPSKLRIRAYQVGFGDCFLLTFFYPQAKKPSDKERHVLMDFGSTGMPKGISPSEQMMKVAEDIKDVCNKKSKKLHLVVATHRHKDHISGFSTAKDGKGTGDIIAGLEPDLVLQPWTEEPEAKDPKLKGKGKGGAKGAKHLVGGQEDPAQTQSLNALHLASLQAMHEISESMKAEILHLTDEKKFKQQLDNSVTDQIAFLANDNDLPNRSAVENLAGMAKNQYLHHGFPLNLSRQLPGVKVHVLGPPTLEQHAEILKQKSTDKDEFWMLQAAAQNFWGLQAATGGLVKDFTAGGSRLFPDAKIFKTSFPSHDRWFIRQLREMRGTQMLSLVRILDKAMNNTSLILLFEVGGKKLLFPGDAQIENWEYALKRDKKNDLPLLKGVNLYKVGHHGSRNATPKTLWDNFENKSKEEGKTQRLKTVVSTMPGKHGHKKSHTEVPRTTLVDALSELSEYHSTEEAADHKDLYIDMEITFAR
jgi:hypothetical protein